jgi:hypothetical protein
MKNSIEEDIKILENMNDGYTFKDCDICNNYNEKTKQCDKHKCMELQAIEHILSDYKRALKENEKLKNENIRLRNIRNEYKYGIENTHLITKSDLVQIDINKYMIEIENGRFVDLKQIYQENKKYKRLAEMNLKSAEEFKNNICEHRCLLKSENKEQKELIERMKRFLLKENKMRDYLDYLESEE